MDKAVVLARGLGTRMRKAAAAAALDENQAAIAAMGLKAMIPIGRPFLDYVLSAVADAGISQVCLIIGPEHDLMRQYYGEKLKPRRLSIHFAVQAEPRGTADAVAAAEGFAGRDDFLAINSDNYYPVTAIRRLRQLDGPGVALFDWEALASAGGFSSDRLRKFSVGVVDSEGLLRKILEKPDQQTLDSLPKPLGVSMNCWRFGPAIFEACRAIGPSPRGEYELTDAVQHAIDHLGVQFRAITVSEPVLDLTNREDIVTVGSRLAGKEVDL